jgi:hypothetical protein
MPVCGGDFGSDRPDPDLRAASAMAMLRRLKPAMTQSTNAAPISRWLRRPPSGAGAGVLLHRVSPGRPWWRGGVVRWSGYLVVLPLSADRGGEREWHDAVPTSALQRVSLADASSSASHLLRSPWW